MSNLTGHYRITLEAISELRRESQTTGLALLPSAVVERDLKDVLSLGHWSDFAQKHHFMRPFDGTSPYEAYEQATQWIHSNGVIAAERLRWSRDHMATPTGLGFGIGVQSTTILGRLVPAFHASQFIPLGNAIHALEDSFAEGHVQRSNSADEQQPGAIEHIKRYSGSEKEGHEEGDAAWQSDAGLSLRGRQAKNAVKALLRIVLDTATQSRSPMTLRGWNSFAQQWLRPSPSLSRTRDRALDLIDKFSNKVRVGNSNLMTLNFDESGLANALLKETADTIHSVFQVLDTKFNSDADDVAELFVKGIMQERGDNEAKLRSNPALVQLLIKILDEGPTSSGEHSCIQYLQSL